MKLLEKEKQISEENLSACLNDLRHTLQNIGSSIVFFDIKSFYAYIERYMNDTDKRRTVRLLNLIEPYIPVVVSDDNIDLFLEAAMRNDVNEVERLENQFISASKIRFIRSLVALESDDTWRDTIDTCQTIRRYKTEGVFSL